VPGTRFTIGVYQVQIGAGASPCAINVATSTDTAWAATEEASFNDLQQLVLETTFPTSDHTNAAQAALLRAGLSIRLNDASIAAKGLTEILWSGAIDWQTGYAAALALLPSL